MIELNVTIHELFYTLNCLEYISVVDAVTAEYTQIANNGFSNTMSY